jgi:hypothetical protein
MSQVPPTRTPYKATNIIPSLRPSGRVTITVDSDLLPACQDQAQAMAVSFEEWVQRAANDGLRQMLGV